MYKRNRFILYFSVICLMISPAIVLSQTDNDINNSRKNAITETVQKISPAVVGINVTAVQQVNPFGSFFNNDPFFKQFFGQQQKVKELGSGFIISPDGYICY